MTASPAPPARSSTSRPWRGPIAGDELNGLLPERFFALQDELKAGSRRLVAASLSRNHAAMADEFAALAKSCVSCHDVYLRGDAPAPEARPMMLDDHYSRLLTRTPTMPAAEQQALAERYARSHDRHDAERLVLGNLRLVVKLARELGGRYRGDFMDLVQEGNAGLTHAVERFDPKRDVKLSTYAALWIRAYIMRYLMDTSRIVRHTSTREGRRRFFARTLPGSDVSLDAPVRHEHDGAWDSVGSMLESLPDGDDCRPDVQVETREYLARVHEAVVAFPKTIDKRGGTILKMRTLSETPARLADVGRRLAISGERARQLEARVLTGLRAFLEERVAA